MLEITKAFKQSHYFNNVLPKCQISQLLLTRHKTKFAMVKAINAQQNTVDALTVKF